MGILDFFQPKRIAPVITSILPDVAKQEIMNGRLPILKTDNIFLKSGEVCHFIDKAIYEKKKPLASGMYAEMVVSACPAFSEAQEFTWSDTS